MSFTKMQQRRGTVAQWTAANTILSGGEIGVVVDPTDLLNNGKIKMGDGVTPWNSLPYVLNDTYNAAKYASINGSQTLSGLKTFSDGITVNTKRIQAVASPEQATDAVNKEYVDNAISGLNWKQAVNLLADTNIALTGDTETLVVDGHAALDVEDDGYRLLLIGQTTTSENGIYVYTDNNAIYTLTRAEDADEPNGSELVDATVFVQEGTVYGTSSWVQSNHYLVDFNDQEWVQFSGAALITAGPGLIKYGNTISVGGTINRIVANNDSIDISANYIGQPSITTLGTVEVGTWEAESISPIHGGTGLTSYGTGDLLYASNATTLAKLPAATTGNALITNGVGTLPSWGKIDIASHVSGVATNIPTFLGTPSSANLFSALTTRTGTGGNVVFSTAPIITNATLDGIKTISGTTNITGTTTIGAGATLTTPTISTGMTVSSGTLDLAAGTTIAAPLDFDPGTNLTTPAAGALEYDGNIFYATPNTSLGRATISTPVFTSGVGTAGVAATTNYALFPAANDTITLPIGTYQVELNVRLLMATSTVSAPFGFNIKGAGSAQGSLTWNGTASITDGGGANEFQIAATAFTTTGTGTMNLSAASAVAGRVYLVRGTGILKITTAGSINPSYRWAAAMTSGVVTLYAQNHMIITPLTSIGTSTFSGAWS
jgi:hypothetical protein